jgi:hypothetical protein
LDLLQHPANLGGVGYVGLHGQGAAPRLLDFGYDPIGRRLIFFVIHPDSRTVLG